MHVNTKLQNPLIQTSLEIKPQRSLIEKNSSNKRRCYHSHNSTSSVKAGKNTLVKTDLISLSFLRASDLSKVFICSKAMKINAEKQSRIKLQQYINLELLKETSWHVRREEQRDLFMEKIQFIKYSKIEFYHNLIQLFNNDPTLKSLI